MTNVIGIDLGTTYSAVARLDSTGRPEIIRDESGRNLTPSVIYEEEPGHFLVGWDAAAEWFINEDQVASKFKRQMGDDTVYRLNKTPTQLSTLVLTKLKKLAEAGAGPISTAVVTVPANFTNKARSATLSAAKSAGLPVSLLINEPTAAALYYAFTSNCSGTVAVYDLGGGTFDVSILRISGNDTEILASHGNQKLGGDDIERKLFELIAEKYAADNVGSALTETHVRDGGKDLEDIKKELSSRQKVTVRIIDASNQRVNIEITRDEFEQAIDPLVVKAEMLVESALQESGIEISSINDVILVGGSTRIPAVRNSVHSLFGKAPISVVNVDEAVALGAAVYAGLKADGTVLSEVQKSAVSRMQLTDVANHYLGTIVLEELEERRQVEDRVSILIEKNTPLPCSVTETYYTVHDNQTGVRCTVTQAATDERDPRWVTTVWEGSLGPLPSGRPSGQEIRVTYSLNEDGMLRCHFLDVASGKQQEKQIDLRGGTPADTHADLDAFLVE